MVKTLSLLFKEKQIKLLFRMDLFSKVSFRVTGRAAMGFLTCPEGLAWAGCKVQVWPWGGG